MTLFVWVIRLDLKDEITSWSLSPDIFSRIMVLKRFQSSFVRYNFFPHVGLLSIFAMSSQINFFDFAHFELFVDHWWILVQREAWMNLWKKRRKKFHGKNIKMISVKLGIRSFNDSECFLCFFHILNFVFSAAHAKGSWNEKPVHILYGAFYQPQTEIWKKPLWVWKNLAQLFILIY